MINTMRRTYFQGKKVSRESIQEAAVVSVVRGDGDLDHSSFCLHLEMIQF